MLEQEFNRIYQLHSKMVYNLCLSYLQNRSEAEEACQNVFIKVYNKYDTFKNQSELKTWIYRISINESLDQIRVKKRNKRFRFLNFLGVTGEEHTQAKEMDHPGILIEDKEALENIFKAMNDLSENQKTALVLKAMEGLSQKEIGIIMNLSEKAVESLLSRARNNLRIKLEGNEGK